MKIIFKKDILKVGIHEFELPLPNEDINWFDVSFKRYNWADTGKEIIKFYVETDEFSGWNTLLKSGAHGGEVSSDYSGVKLTYWIPKGTKLRLLVDVKHAIETSIQFTTG